MNALRMIHKINKINKERSELTLSREEPLKVTRSLSEIAEEEEEDQHCGPRYSRDYLITKKKCQHSAASIEGPGSYAGNEILTSDESIDYYKSLAPQMYERIMSRRRNKKSNPELMSSEEEKRTRARSRTESFKEEIGKEQILGNKCDALPNEENGIREEEHVEEIIFDLEL